MKTDWNRLDKDLSKEIKSYGTIRAKKALETILGDTWIEDAVQKATEYNAHSSELAMDCLRHISSVKAAKIAYQIYLNDTNNDRKSMAVWLIKQLAVEESYEWIEDFLNDQNVMVWGIGVLDQLLWCEIIDYEDEKERVDYLFELSLNNSNGALKENVDFIKSYLHERENHRE
ncbi:MAG: hypothetical protein AAFU57_09095 [Bacteroidota bacterium]